MVAATLRGLLGRTPEQGAGFIILGLTIVVASYAWVALTVRCPGCGARLLWKSMRERTPSDWLSWLVRLASCPMCGSDGAHKDRVS
jgi:DNA-directed RNA polymerase subunit RPC12/RpoP